MYKEHSLALVERFKEVLRFLFVCFVFILVMSGNELENN